MKQGGNHCSPERHQSNNNPKLEKPMHEEPRHTDCDTLRSAQLYPG